MGRYNDDPTHCHRCGCFLTAENKYRGTNCLCKECHNAMGREYKKRRRSDANDTYRHDEIKRAHKYYRTTGQARRDDRMAKYKTACLKCGETRVYCLCFHHIDPKQKKFNIGGGTAKIALEEDIANEVKKCVCLCQNCHKEFHHFYGNRMKHPREALEEYLEMKLPIPEEKENKNV